MASGRLKRKTIGCVPIALGVFGLFFLITLIGALRSGKPASTDANGGNGTNEAASPVSSPPNTTGNILNDVLFKKSPAQQASVLGKIVGERCRGKRAFYDGVGREGLADRHAFWSVACRNGKSYMVEIGPDDKNNVIECSLMKAIHAGECFTKF